MERNKNVRNVVLDAHPQELAVVVRYQLNSNDPEQRSKSHQKIIHLKELSENVDIQWLSSVVMEKCPLIPEVNRKDLQQILFYLQRNCCSRSQSASSISDRSLSSSTSVKANMNEIDSYIELLYEDMSEKNRGAMCILELAKNPSNLVLLAENEILISALARVLRDEWKKNLELTKNLLSIFLHFSSYSQTQHIVIEHKMGAFCMNAIELELARGDDWLKQMKSADEKTAKKCEIALRREHAMLAVCVNLLLNMSEDLAVEMKMLRRDLLTLLSRCLSHAIQPSQSSVLLLPVIQFFLKLSAIVENHAVIEKEQIAQKVALIVPKADVTLRHSCLSLLFNLSFNPSIRSSLISVGLIQYTAQLFKQDDKALNVLYQLSLSHDARSLLPFTDSITQLVQDTLSGSASGVSKAILLNACLDKRSAQIATSSDGSGVDSLMRLSIEEGDLLAAKIVRNIASHEDTAHPFLIKWIPSMMSIAMEDGFSEEEAKEARALELLAISNLCNGVDWPKLNNELNISKWLADSLIETRSSEFEPFQLQQVILASRIASTIDGSKSLVHLVDHFLQLLHTLQEDDELVIQLLFFFVCLLRHNEIAQMILSSDSSLANYILDLMHDNNSKVVEQAEEAMRIISSIDGEWKKRFMTEKFRFYNAQWLEMVEKEGGDEDDDEQYSFSNGALYFDDEYVDDDQNQLF